MNRFRRRHRLNLRLLLLVLLMMALLPLPVTGQEPDSREPDATVISTEERTLYLPLIRAHCTGVPPIPLLESPLPGAIFTAGEAITFQWTSPDSCATEQRHYALQIATAPTFSPDTIVYGVGFHATGPYQETLYPETSYILTNTEPGVYYWRVSAYNGTHQSGWSDPHELTLESSASASQLLRNPSFEDDPDTIYPWQPLVSDLSYHLVNHPEEAREGQQYLAAHRQNNAWGNKSFYQDISQPQAGQTYHFALWIRAPAEAISNGQVRNGRLALWAFGGSAPREHNSRNFQLKDTGWHCVETSLKVTGSGHPYLRAEVYLTSRDAIDLYFDDAILRADGQATCPPPPPIDGSTIVTHGQGFDTCAAPGVPQLAAWKQNSPYEYVGIYLGGANHYPPCKAYNQQYQTPAWFNEVSQQGWRFIPIWVGPQAPCTAYNIRLSEDINLARDQGVAEAQQALQAAYNLGLLGGFRSKTIIYYDMEHYPTGNIPCHNAVNAFLEGWVNELQDWGQSAGIYGSASAANSWYLLNQVPDSLWLPWYISPGYDPNMSVQVVNQQWVNESYWSNHRLFQYSNSHNEIWGGITLNIDNDTAVGLVAMGGEPAPPPTLRAMQLLTPRQGWVLVNHRLFWTDTGGERWLDRTPTSTRLIHGVFFLDSSSGWLVSTIRDEGQLYLSVTRDGGRSWQTSPLQPGQDVSVTQVHLHFIDRQQGWLVLKLATGLNFSEGLLFKTEDGGQSWSPLTIPVGEPVRFINKDVGWTAGGPTKGELYQTQDGGQSWQPLAPAGGQAAYGLPVFDTLQQGAIAATISGQTQSRVEIYTTADGGQQWQQTESVSLPQALGLGVIAPVEILNSQSWIIASQDYPDLSHLINLELATPQAGWAHTRAGNCPGHCRTQDRLWRTGDGGQTWLPLELPH